MTDAPDLTGDLAASDLALHGAGGWWPRARDVVVAEGADAATYLQGQLSQDVQGLAVGASTASFLLQPDGKVTAWLRVTRLADDRFVLDVDEGWGSAVVERLRRFLLRVKVTLSLHAATAVAVRAGTAARIDELRPEADPSIAVAASVADDLPGFDLLPLSDGGDAEPSLPEPPDGLPRVDPAAYELLRVERRLPAMGSELDDRTIPAEAGQHVLDASVSFTKGCYTGQELVARIDSRGNHVPRQVRTLAAEGSERLDAGWEVVHDGKAAGTLTTAAWSPRLGAPVALASLARAVDDGAAVVVRGDGAEVTAVADAVSPER
jgi:folate-binding protein YgfZ